MFSILTMRENYRLASAIPEYKIMAPFVEEQQGLSVFYKALTAEESRTYLSRDVIDRGYQAVHVTIQNNTANSFKVSPNNVSLPLAKPKDVAMQVTKSAIPRSVGYKVAGFLFWPFMIPGTIDSIKTYKNHQLLKKDFASKALKEETILPFSTIHRILFIAEEEYSPEFSLTLIDMSTGAAPTFYSNLS